MNAQRPEAWTAAAMADSAVPATYNGLPVTLDKGGRVTSLNGATLTFSERNVLLQVVDGTTTESYGADGYLRRIARVNNQGVEEFYAYEDTTTGLGGHSIGPAGTAMTSYTGLPPFDRAPSTLPTLDTVPPQNIVAVLDSSGGVTSSFLYDAVDSPLRLARSGLRYYYEVDLAGNVRRIRDPLGNDLAGIATRRSGRSTPRTPTPRAVALRSRCSGRGDGLATLAGGIYDVRARQWSPGMGVFLQVDEFEMHDRRSTLWGWPHMNPIRTRDPSGKGDPAQLDACLASCEEAFWDTIEACTTMAPPVIPECSGYARGLLRFCNAACFVHDFCGYPPSSAELIMPPPQDIDAFLEVIRSQEKCDARWIDTVLAHDRGGLAQRVRRREVHIFALDGHAELSVLLLGAVLAGATRRFTLFYSCHRWTLRLTQPASLSILGEGFGEGFWLRRPRSAVQIETADSAASAMCLADRRRHDHRELRRGRVPACNGCGSYGTHLSPVISRAVAVA